MENETRERAYPSLTFYFSFASFLVKSENFTANTGLSYGNCFKGGIAFQSYSALFLSRTPANFFPATGYVESRIKTSLFLFRQILRFIDSTIRDRRPAIVDTFDTFGNREQNWYSLK